MHIFLQNTHSRAHTQVLRGRPRLLPPADRYIFTGRPGKREPRSCDSTQVPRTCLLHYYWTDQRTQTNLPTLKSTRWISSPWQQAWKVRQPWPRSNFLPLPTALTEGCQCRSRWEACPHSLAFLKLGRGRGGGGKEPAGLVSSNSKGGRALMFLLLLLLLPKRKSNTKQKSTYECSVLMLLPCFVDFYASPV